MVAVDGCSWQGDRAMRVFLGNAPWSKPGLYGVRAGSRWPHFEREGTEYMPFPFFLAYGAAVLEEDGFDVTLVDAIAEKLTLARFVERAQDRQPALIVLEVSTISIEADLAVVQAIRSAMGDTVKLALCGLHSLMYSPDFLEKNPLVDFVLVGEYEITLLELARALREDGVVGTVKGMLYRTTDGNIVDGGKRDVIADLDSLPWPARHHLPMHNYHDEPGNIPRPSVQMWASRGCPFKCSFCAWPQIMYGGNQYRFRNPVDVVDEMEFLVREWGFQSVYFDDDTFNIGKKRLREICREIRRRHLDVPWAAMARADLMDEELLAELSSAGLVAIKYGVESGSQELLSRCGKTLYLEKARKGIELTEKLGIKYHLTFMFGLPGETRESAQKTVDMALALNAESAQFTIATPFPGSSFFDQMKREGRLREDDFASFDGYHNAVIRTEGLSSSDLEEIVEDARTRFERHRQQRTTCVSFPEQEGVPLVSIIVPHLKGRERLRSCIDSIVAQEYPRTEVLVVDSGSQENSMAGFANDYPATRVIHLDVNLGFAVAVNRAIDESSGSLLALINDDVRIRPDWIANMVRAMGLNMAVGSGASTVLRADDPAIVDSAGLGLTRLGHSFALRAGVDAATLPSEPTPVFGPCAAAALYRREMFERIGLFDERFGTYIEDVDIALRARLHGYECMHVPGAVAIHDGAASSGGQHNPFMVEHVARNTLWLLLKAMPRSVLKANLPRLAAYFLSSQVFHTLFTHRGTSHLKGVLAGVVGFRDMVQSREKVLGARRVDDPAIGELLRCCEEELAQLGTSAWKRRLLSRLHDSPLGFTTSSPSQ